MTTPEEKAGAETAKKAACDILGQAKKNPKLAGGALAAIVLTALLSFSGGSADKPVEKTAAAPESPKTVLNEDQNAQCVALNAKITETRAFVEEKGAELAKFSATMKTDLAKLKGDDKTDADIDKFNESTAVFEKAQTEQSKRIADFNEMTKKFEKQCSGASYQV